MNEKEISNLINIGDLEYPQMRLVDLIFWKAGNDANMKKENKKV